MALAPSLLLFGVPSKLRRNSSTAFWFLTSRLAATRAGAMVLLTFSTAFKTPLLINI